jgi:hypothetical protein
MGMLRNGDIDGFANIMHPQPESTRRIFQLSAARKVDVTIESVA